MPRDACTCLGLKEVKRYTHQAYALCAACDAWDDGYVQVEGERRYLRAMWVLVNTAEEWQA